MHRTVLVVNVHKSDRDLLESFFARVHYHVLPTTNTDEALALCRDYKGAIHLLVTDSDVPDASGWEVAERATALRPGIIIVYLPKTLLSNDKPGQFIGTQSKAAAEQALKKANMLLDVTEALIHKTQQQIQ